MGKQTKAPDAPAAEEVEARKPNNPEPAPKVGDRVLYRVPAPGGASSKQLAPGQITKVHGDGEDPDPHNGRLVNLLVNLPEGDPLPVESVVFEDPADPWDPKNPAGNTWSYPAKA